MVTILLKSWLKFSSMHFFRPLVHLIQLNKFQAGKKIAPFWVELFLLVWVRLVFYSEFMKYIYTQINLLLPLLDPLTPTNL